MDAEIRKLTYVTRPGGVKPGSGLLGSAGISFGELPPVPAYRGCWKQPPKITDVRLEARLIGLEREREEDERRHREVLAAARERAAGQRALRCTPERKNVTGVRRFFSNGDCRFSAEAGKIFRGRRGGGGSSGP